MRFYGHSGSNPISSQPLSANLGVLHVKIQHLAMNAQFDLRSGKTGEQYQIAISGLENLASYTENSAQYLRSLIDFFGSQFHADRASYQPVFEENRGQIGRAPIPPDIKKDKTVKDNVPYRLVIEKNETQNKRTFSLFHYQLDNQEGQKLTGNYGLEEHLWTNRAANHHAVVGHNSENIFVPQDPQGEWVDSVGFVSRIHVRNKFDFDVYQTFSVRYNHKVITLSTEFEHISVVTGGGSHYSNNVIDIKP